MHSALWLVLAFFTAAAHWLMLGAEFLAIVLVLVYVGAVMVLFLFVIMLLNLSHEKPDLQAVPIRALGAAIAASVAVAMVGVRFVSPGALAFGTLGAAGQGSPLDAMGGSAVSSAEAFANPVGAVAKPLFETYLLPFELTSILLLAAAVGAVVLAKRKI